MTAQSLLGKRVSIYDGNRGEELYQTEMGPAGRRASDGVPPFGEFLLSSLRRPYRAFLDAFVCILGILQQTFLCLNFVGGAFLSMALYRGDQEPD
jgi:hypothetical protein